MNYTTSPWRNPLSNGICVVIAHKRATGCFNVPYFHSVRLRYGYKP